MFKSFSNQLSWRDVSFYFRGCYFKWPFETPDGEPRIARLLDGDTVSLYPIPKPGTGGRAEPMFALTNAQKNHLVSNMELLDYPHLGYFPFTENGFIAHASVYPMDQATRGFSPQRIQVVVDTSVAAYSVIKDTLTPSVSHLQAFVGLSGGYAFPRFTEFKDGLARMLSRDLFSFAVNHKTACVPNVGRDCEQYPISILYNGAEIGKVDGATREIISCNPKCNLNRIINKRVA